LDRGSARTAGVPGPADQTMRTTMLPDHVQTFIDAEIAANQTDFSDLRAVILNGTLKPSPTPSHTPTARSKYLPGPPGASELASNTIRVVDHT